MRSLTRAILATVIAAIIALGAAHGLAAESAADAEITPGEVLNGDISSDTPPEELLATSMTYYLLAWASGVSTWAYQHPVVAELVLMNLLWIVLAIFVFRWLFLGSLVVYTAVAEYRAQKREQLVA